MADLPPVPPLPPLLPVCRGFGTVRLTSQADVDAACQKLNNTKFEERSISVRVDRFA